MHHDVVGMACESSGRSIEAEQLHQTIHEFLTKQELKLTAFLDDSKPFASKYARALILSQKQEIVNRVELYKTELDRVETIIRDLAQGIECSIEQIKINENQNNAVQIISSLRFKKETLLLQLSNNHLLKNTLNGLISNTLSNVECYSKLNELLRGDACSPKNIEQEFQTKLRDYQKQSKIYNILLTYSLIIVGYGAGTQLTIDFSVDLEVAKIWLYVAHIFGFCSLFYLVVEVLVCFSERVLDPLREIFLNVYILIAIIVFISTVKLYEKMNACVRQAQEVCSINYNLPYFDVINWVGVVFSIVVMIAALRFSYNRYKLIKTKSELEKLMRSADDLVVH